MSKPKKATPPNVIASEMHVLGAMLQFPEAVETAMEILKPEQFYRETHQVIFNAMKELWNRGDVIDNITITQKLDGHPKLSEQPTYIANLLDSATSSAKTEHHSRLILRAWQLREIRFTGLRLTRDAEDAGHEKEPEEVIFKAEQELFAILNSYSTGCPELIGPVVKSEFEKAGKLPKDGLIGLTTGIPKLNEMTDGWQNGQMIIIAGRPSQGKTNLALHFAQACAVRENIRILFFTLEMEKELIAHRLLSSLSGIDSTRIKKGNYTPSESATLQDAAKKCERSPFYIDDTSGLTMTNLSVRAKRAVDSGAKMIVIDYLGLFTPEKRDRSVYQDVSEWSRRLKVMAGDLKVPVLVLCQLNRKPDNRTDNQPKMSDLRDSGSIEQDADTILLIHRPGLYDKKTPKSKMELILEKQRCGQTGIITLVFDEKTGRISEEDKQHGGVPF